MATGKFHLQQPYQEALTEKEKEAKKKTLAEGKIFKRKLNPNETRIYLYVIIQMGEVIKIKTPYVLYPCEWDFKKQERIDKLPGSPEFNRRLVEFKKKYLDRYHDIYEKHPDYSFKTISRLILEESKDEGKPSKKNKSFFDVLDEFIESKQGVAA
jgi:hypothetical protein